MFEFVDTTLGCPRRKTLGEFKTPEGLIALEKALSLEHPAVHQVAKSLMHYERSRQLDASPRAFAKIGVN